MGLVIKIRAYYDYVRTFYVQTLDEYKAKEKAYQMFREYYSNLHIPTLMDDIKDDEISIDIVATVDCVLF